MSGFIKLLFGSFIAIVLLTLLLAILVLESEPKAVSSAHQQVDDADSVNALLKQARQITRNRFVPQSVVMSYQQINSLLGFSQRAVPDFSGKLVTEDNKLTLLASYRVHFAGVEGYLNLQGQLVSAPGIELKNVKVGDLALSPDWVLSVVTAIINWRTQSDIGELALQQVSQVQVDNKSVTFTLVPIHDFLAQLNQIKNGLGGADNEALRKRVTHYLTFLSQLDIPQHRPGLSLADFMVPLFKRAQMNSTDTSAVTENEAALLALAIYTGHHRLANFVGEVQPFPGKVVMPRYRPMLANRSDLTQHFVISAAIKILSEQGISMAIGEFKELMDRAEGGSGFSFADLAADLAGLKLAVAAMDPDTAKQVQRALANINNESDFFPTIESLPEGLSKSEFSDQYNTVNSPEYKQQVDNINQRIAALPLYASMPEN
ncbi:hypothetical protein [Aliiglaciecola litoralis]|uniref:Uncharacterized protein n=1 Tax=Aliiglaciecola litoralis TaxID=582857 RepID=A0ABP3WPZ5_9ALTE